MREYTSMMAIILEIAYDDQEQPVDDELVRKMSNFVPKSEKILRQTNKKSRLKKIPIAGERCGAAAELCLGVAGIQAEEECWIPKEQDWPHSEPGQRNRRALRKQNESCEERREREHKFQDGRLEAEGGGY